MLTVKSQKKQKKKNQFFATATKIIKYNTEE